MNKRISFSEISWNYHRNIAEINIDAPLIRCRPVLSNYSVFILLKNKLISLEFVYFDTMMDSCNAQPLLFQRAARKYQCGSKGITQEIQCI